MSTFKKFALLFFLFSLVMVPTLPRHSVYNYAVHTLYCNNTAYMHGCRHELGHKMDDDLGTVSRTEEFENALQSYMIKRPKSSLTIALRDPYYLDIREAYAAVYAWSEGDVQNIPTPLRRFFSKDESYLSLYNCLSNGVKLTMCNGLNFSNL